MPAGSRGMPAEFCANLGISPPFSPLFSFLAQTAGKSCVIGERSPLLASLSFIDTKKAHGLSFIDQKKQTWALVPGVPVTTSSMNWEAVCVFWDAHHVFPKRLLAMEAAWRTAIDIHWQDGWDTFNLQAREMHLRLGIQATSTHDVIYLLQRQEDFFSKRRTQKRLSRTHGVNGMRNAEFFGSG